MKIPIHLLHGMLYQRIRTYSEYGRAAVHVANEKLTDYAKSTKNIIGILYLYGTTDDQFTLLYHRRT